MSGFPADYIIQQTQEFKAGMRNNSTPRIATDLMIKLAKAINDQELKEAAEYFASTKPRANINAVETDTVPKTHVRDFFLAAMDGGQKEPIGERIVEIPAEPSDSSEPQRRLAALLTDGSRIYGDGVNVAARLETLSPAGGICVSAAVRESLEGKIDAGFLDLGEQSLKNIARPVRACTISERRGLAPKNIRQEIRYYGANDGVRLAYATAGRGPKRLRRRIGSIIWSTIGRHPFSVRSFLVWRLTFSFSDMMRGGMGFPSGISSTSDTGIRELMDTVISQDSGAGQIKLAVFPENLLDMPTSGDLTTLSDTALAFKTDLVVSFARSADGNRRPTTILFSGDPAAPGQWAYARTHRLRNENLTPAKDLMVIDRPYGRVSLAQAEDLMAPEVSGVMAKMGVDIVAVAADGDDKQLWPYLRSRAGDYIHIVSANRSGGAGIFLGGYQATPSEKIDPQHVTVSIDTAHVRNKKEPRFLDVRPLLQACTLRTC